jgi:hypothetical protein
MSFGEGATRFRVVLIAMASSFFSRARPLVLKALEIS